MGNPDKLVTIYKGHDIRWYQDVTPADRSQIGISPDAFLVGCVASNRPRKGIPVLLDAARQLAHREALHLLLVGGGMDTSEIQELVEASGMAQRIHLLGHQDQVLPLVAACNATILPSTKREGLPKTVIESMALGVASVATATGGSPELIEHEQSGLVIPPADATAITQAIGRLMDEPDWARKLGENGRERIATQFRLEDSISSHEKLFRQLTGKGVLA